MQRGINAVGDLGKPPLRQSSNATEIHIGYHPRLPGIAGRAPIRVCMANYGRRQTVVPASWEEMIGSVGYSDYLVALAPLSTVPSGSFDILVKRTRLDPLDTVACHRNVLAALEISFFKPCHAQFDTRILLHPKTELFKTLFVLRYSFLILLPGTM